ncbi:MAG: tandem-95 repeat protein [Actinobacteria bacterium]|nr:tandem-95 repeat protein [Actinomycetota bacterium]
MLVGFGQLPASAAGPVAVDDTYTMGVNENLYVNAPGVLANDIDAFFPHLPSGQPSEPTAHGDVTFYNDGSFAYRPGPYFSGTDTFTYVVGDGQGGSDTGLVTITVVPSQSGVAVADNYTTTEDTPLTVDAPGLLANDTDPDSDPGNFRVDSVSDPAHGTVALVGVSGSFTYTPDADFTGTDTFTYVLGDGQGGSDTGLVTITWPPLACWPTTSIPKATR